MARHKDVVWSVQDQPNTDQAILCALMDIRDELKGIRAAVERTDRTLQCRNFQRIPTMLKDIRDRRCHRKHV